MSIPTTEDLLTLATIKKEYAHTYHNVIYALTNKLEPIKEKLATVEAERDSLLSTVLHAYGEMVNEGNLSLHTLYEMQDVERRWREGEVTFADVSERVGGETFYNKEGDF